MDNELLKLLCCPETRQRLHMADPEMIARINGRIATGDLRNRAEEVVREPLSEALVREDGRVCYPVREQIPYLLIEESIAVEDAPSTASESPKTN